MVAYSFKKQFAPLILAGTKIGTIRGPRKRHALPGERLQLYQGMRTKYCKKIMPDPVCEAVYPISIDIHPKQIGAIIVGEPHWHIHRSGHDYFAQCDGFEDIAALHAFWVKEHGTGTFEGFWIRWDSPKLNDFGEFLQ